MNMRRMTTLAVAAAFAVAGCSSETRDSIGDDVESAATDLDEALDESGEDATESAARNLAAESGEEQFADAGHEIDGELTCEATVVEEELSKVEINCTGVTTSGGDAVLTGATNEMPGDDFDSLEGLFKATVDGAEVFATDRLGD
jgi:predicted small secreted protein